MAPRIWSTTGVWATVTHRRNRDGQCRCQRLYGSRIHDENAMSAAAWEFETKRGFQERRRHCRGRFHRGRDPSGFVRRVLAIVAEETVREGGSYDYGVLWTVEGLLRRRIGQRRARRKCHGPRIRGRGNKTLQKGTHRMMDD